MLRFIDNARPMNDSLDSLVNNFSNNICNTHCKHYIECKNFKNVKNVRMIALNDGKSVKIVKNCQIILKNLTKYMNIVNIILNKWKRK